MMQIWIVWGDKPLAAFSSEARARAYIARNKAAMRWVCSPVGVNPDGLPEQTLAMPGVPQRMHAGAAH
ncbi:hypothetical protein Q9Q94_04430 [Uliginosibacterium sp. 31-16]|uniref:hypothetical protein n=1 Tax=Uliginosibacterium sp. 31-16 TaxID=3068315 RepID=UPI00273FDDDD|nr:hypothetical protein [Uliginosibacterium sp. 31-16]MDP5238760.1 hypothetical protein [Uliginosibacterium sp. 31-16]